jgi:hypothetical protein
VAKALSPAPPRQTVHSVFPNTAFRSSSSRSFRSLSPWCSRRYLEQSQIVIKISVRIIFITSAFLCMLPSQVDSHPFVEEVPELRKITTTITVVKVTDPSPNLLIELPDDHLVG